ncbi:MAG: GtrA family protein [Hyphomicrobiaceae bacterium]
MIEPAPADPRPEPTRRDLVRHGAGFLVAGLIAFATDAGVLLALTHVVGLDPFSARLLAIGVALVTAWLAHRTLTFAVKVPPSLREFVSYAGVAASAATVNYAVYAGMMIVWRDLPPIAALVGATLVSMCVSYSGMRFGVFRPR